MVEHKTQTRIIYADTDQMGFVYHANYVKFFEIGRVEVLRSLGLSYKEIENLNIILPVAELKIKYLTPAVYDDIITIHTSMPEYPINSKLIFLCKIFNNQNQLLCKGEVLLYVLNKQTKKTCTLPAQLLNEMKKYF